MTTIHQVYDTELIEHCPIDCKNGGWCRRGAANFPGQAIAPTTEYLFAVDQVDGYSCRCREGFTGHDCSVPFTACGQTNTGEPAVCYHEADCRSLEDQSPRHVCNCFPNAKGEVFTGKYCEIMVDPKEYCDADGEMYCIHGGKCLAPTADSDCDCPKGFNGLHCEYPSSDEPSKCTLSCFHGECVFEERYQQDLPDPDYYLNYDANSIDGMHCQCPPGYAGVLCQVRAELCGNADWFCLHSSKCVGDETAEFGYQCVCDKGAADCVARPAAQMCLPTLGVDYAQSMAVPAFCSNGGTCKDIEINGEIHPGCECPPLYYGDHCEFIKNGIDLEGEGLMSDARISIKRREDLRRYGMMSLYIFITAIVLTGLVLYTRRRLLQRRRRRRRGRRKKHDGNIQMNLHSFRDENFGASSPNGAMLFPSFRRPDREITITDRLHNVQIS